VKVSKELDAYVEACTALHAATAEAERIAKVVADGAKALARSPGQWAFGEAPVESERHESEGMPVDIFPTEWVGISARTWPVVGALMVIKQNYLDAAANVETARKAPLTQ
jgi:hypothetical protein